MPDEYGSPTIKINKIHPMRVVYPVSCLMSPKYMKSYGYIYCQRPSFTFNQPGITFNLWRKYFYISSYLNQSLFVIKSKETIKGYKQ